MPSDHPHNSGTHVNAVGFESVEYLLFDSLVHHLVEKGVLTRNDALSVIQTAAEVVIGRADELDGTDPTNAEALATLKRVYSSFEALSDRTTSAPMDGRNVHVLRAPLHGEQPRFPPDEN